MKKIIVGMFWGDEGKGSTVNYFCETEKNIDYVVRFSGGHQCGHHVINNNKSHIFSQFGSGTLSDVPTYYGPYCIFELLSWIKERDNLKKLNITTPQYYLDPNCLVTTLYDRMLNQSIESYQKHGSCGVGFGQTRKYWLDYGQDAIFTKDLFDTSNLLQKLRLKWFRAKETCNKFGINMVDAIRAYSPEFLYKQYTGKEVNAALSLIINRQPNFVIGKYKEDRDLIFEGSQGILLDEDYGDFPNVTWSQTTPIHAYNLLEEKDLDSKDVEIVGIIRSYMTRHGAGPFPSEYKLPFKNENGSEENEFNGKMRYGLFDFDLFKKSVNIANPHYIFLNCMDEYPGLVYKDGIAIKMDKTDFISKISEICPVKYIGYGPEAEKKIIYNHKDFA